jgi:hypothetical protein
LFFREAQGGKTPETYHGHQCIGNCNKIVVSPVVLKALAAALKGRAESITTFSKLENPPTELSISWLQLTTQHNTNYHFTLRGKACVSKLRVLANALRCFANALRMLCIVRSAFYELCQVALSSLLCLALSVDVGE